MDIPFDAVRFFGVFRAYNEFFWPVQAVLLGLALAIVALLLTPRPFAGAAISALLVALWLWMAFAYHLHFFARINPLAPLFAALSLTAALVFLWQGIHRRRLTFAAKADARSWAGALLIVFALVVYPLWRGARDMCIRKCPRSACHVRRRSSRSESWLSPYSPRPEARWWHRSSGASSGPRRLTFSA